jgi:hypothetical protein
MTKQTKIIIAGVVLIILMVIGYYLFKKPSLPAMPPPADPNAVKGQPATYGKDDFPFNVGTQGDNVRRLQLALNAINAKVSPSRKIMVDSIFGPETRNAMLLTLPATLSGVPIFDLQLNAIILKGNQA